MSEVVTKIDNKLYSDENELLEKIRKVVIDKKNWIERKEICEILKLPLNTQLVEGVYNSKIGQLLYKHLRKEGFDYKKVQLDPEDKFKYEIWVCANDLEAQAGMGLLAQPESDFDSSSVKPQKLEDVLKKIHGENYQIVEGKQKGPKKAPKAPEPELDDADGDNENLNKIIKLINHGENLFITGYAGTGKSYILNKLKKKFPISVTSTTGLAAVNIQGQTIHSWAGVGICNRPVEDVVEKILKRSNLKKQITECKILAIDEISMLDARSFDYIDQVLRALKDESKPFGGIQVLLFGDFFQLPPVSKESGFCFSSNCWQSLDLKTVFLEKIYRQNDEKFIRSLNNLRLNQLTQDDIRLFYDREVNYDTYDSDILHIFSTNREADNYNTFKFNSVQKSLFTFNSLDKIHRKKSIIEVNKNNLSDKLTKFDLMTLETFEKSCKAPSALELKEGCRVMLLKNLNFKKGLINGSTGTVLELKQGGEEDQILVRFDNGVEEFIAKQIFEAYRDGDVVVSREQYPLRLAYGITIHKSQGMTLEKLIVDCDRIFECGQVYVALSRIKSLDGLYLKSFNPKKVLANEEVVNFYNKLKASTEPLLSSQRK